MRAVMDIAEIKAYVAEIRGNRAGDRADKIRVTATYEHAKVVSSIEFDLTLVDARKFYVGQEITLIIKS